MRSARIRLGLVVTALAAGLVVVPSTSANAALSYCTVGTSSSTVGTTKTTLVVHRLETRPPTYYRYSVWTKYVSRNGTTPTITSGTTICSR
jgi:hypothetical protein